MEFVLHWTTESAPHGHTQACAHLIYRVNTSFSGI